jgi:predicted transcriptional regulator of viral defense system
MIERLKKKFGENEPIFTSEILEEMCDYSRPRVFQLLKKAEQEETLIKFDKGVYYIPTSTRYGKSIISVEQVIKKKYISDNGGIFGIYGGLQIQQSFMLTYQVPNAIEVVTNNETMWIREIKLKNRNVILRKSRTTITNDNVDAYTILELFSNIDIKKYLTDTSVQREVINYIKNKNISSKDIYELVGVFPAKTTKNIIESGIINEFA